MCPKRRPACIKRRYFKPPPPPVNRALFGLLTRPMSAGRIEGADGETVCAIVVDKGGLNGIPSGAVLLKKGDGRSGRRIAPLLELLWT